MELVFGFEITQNASICSREVDREVKIGHTFECPMELLRPLCSGRCQAAILLQCWVSCGFEVRHPRPLLRIDASCSCPLRHRWFQICKRNSSKRPVRLPQTLILPLIIGKHCTMCEKSLVLQRQKLDLERLGYGQLGQEPAHASRPANYLSSLFTSSVSGHIS